MGERRLESVEHHHIAVEFGITGTTATTILNDIGAASNPNQSEELQLCTQLLMAAGNPALVAALQAKLVTEAGIPADAAAIAMTLTQPGVNVATAVLQIEQLIKSGGRFHCAANARQPRPARLSPGEDIDMKTFSFAGAPAPAGGR